jgi:hypothetical protein
MINIDFQGGMHGNFLEYICNRFLAGIDIAQGLPFNNLGAAHHKTYLSPKKFKCGHFSTDVLPLTSDRVIAIKITHDDLLAAQSVSLLRAGDYNISPNELEKDTYNKLNNRNYRWVLDTIVEKYFHNQIVQSYRNVMDETWPMIHSLSDYHDLPEHIKYECETLHDLRLFEFNEQNPDCPRHVLREFFKFGFLDPENHGFLLQQDKFIYPPEVKTYDFPFGCFYNLEKFHEQISMIGDWAGYEIVSDREKFDRVHQEFLSRQPYKNIKSDCDSIVKKIENMKSVDITTLSVIEEAYIEASLELRNSIKIEPKIDKWYSDSDEISVLLT